MKAYTKEKYGGPEVLKLEDVDKPTLTDDGILVKVKANSVNPADWRILRGKPFFARFSFGLFKPKHKIPGADFAGVVEAVGSGVSNFKVGDRVFGETLEGGAFAEYTCAPAKVTALMPPNASFEEVAGIPLAGITALQALNHHGQLKQGDSVLVNGASGGVGHLVVQIAKAYGATVTGICSSRNVDFVKSIGADEVLAYDKQNIQAHEGKYTLIIDAHGNLTFNDFKRMGQSGAIVGFTSMGHMFSNMMRGGFSKFPLAAISAKANSEALEILAGLIEEKKLKVHIEKKFPASKIPQAIAHNETGRTRGKVVMVWEGS